MFSSSVRRVASAASTPPITSPLSSLSSLAPHIVGLSRPLTYCHQRRFSSSKPSSPSSGSKGVPEGPAVARTSSQSAADGKKSKATSRRKTKDASAVGKGKEDSLPKMPSVPSTSHITPGQICASAFFSMYRPISILRNFPAAVSDEQFASIFELPKARGTKDVINTLSSTIDKYSDSPSYEWNEQTDELRAAITAESYKEKPVLYGEPDAGIDFPTHILPSRYQPFHPPPPPVPATEATLAEASSIEAEHQAPETRTFHALLTVEQSTDEHGEVTWEATSSPLVEEPQSPAVVPMRFLSRMKDRQERYEDYREQRAEGDMWAISVKRQRKLKMKKHKHKKLMRKTRNLRRRLDRL